MKHIIALFIVLTSFQTLAQEDDCLYKTVDDGKKVYVIPRYVTDVIYVVDSVRKTIIGKLNWGLDREMTIRCDQKVKSMVGSDVKVFVSRIRMDEIMATFPGERSVRVNVSQDSSGHWNGATSFVNIDYSLKDEIEESSLHATPTVRLDGDVRFNMEVMKRGIVSYMSCTKNEEGVGVLALIKKLNGVKRVLDAQKEEVLEALMDSCVKFSNVTSSGFADFEKEQRVRTKLVKGEFPVYGLTDALTSEKLPLVRSERTQIIRLEK